MVSERRPIEDADDDQYEALEAEAVDNVEEASEEADELDGVSANAPIDERGSPDEIEIRALSGEDIREPVAVTPETEEELPENADEPIVRAPDEWQPETQEHVPGDLDSEGDWPDQ